MTARHDSNHVRGESTKKLAREYHTGIPQKDLPGYLKLLKGAIISQLFISFSSKEEEVRLKGGEPTLSEGVRGEDTSVVLFLRMKDMLRMRLQFEKFSEILEIN